MTAPACHFFDSLQLTKHRTSTALPQNILETRLVVVAHWTAPLVGILAA